jgi:hypothetical protein
MGKGKRRILADFVTTAERQRRRARLRAKIVEAIAGGVVAALTGAMLAWLLVNWVMGCGEIIYTIDGPILGECVFAPWMD